MLKRNKKGKMKNLENPQESVTSNKFAKINVNNQFNTPVSEEEEKSKLVEIKK